VSALFPEISRAENFTEVANLRGRLWLGNDATKPAIALKPVDLTELPRTTVSIGVTPIRVFDAGRDFLVEIEDEEELAAYQPDWTALRALSKVGCILSSPSATATAAFRFFAPRAGIDEDRASGSATAALVHFWGRDATDPCTFRQRSDCDTTIQARRLMERVVIAGDVIELGRMQ
jgi:predicted PhzF superfamily epimerase YddE/YHI9